MDRLLNVFKLNLLISLLIIFCAVFFGVYLPMRHELIKEVHESFSNSAKLSEKAIENFLEHCVEGAESLSSRTMIRKMILEYLNGRTSLEELRQYTTPKYRDGTSALRNLRGATRIVSGNIITSIGILNVDKIKNYENVSRTTLKIEIEDRSVIVSVCSPIWENNTIIGHDIVSFDMTEILNEINTGKGIKKEDMETLFEAFKQISSTARRRYQGAGLGLYLSRKLATLLGGEIRVESVYNKGSTFTFVLPFKSTKENNHEEKDTGGG